MTDFLDIGETQETNFLEIGEDPKTLQPEQLEALVEMFSAALDRPSDEVKADMESGSYPLLRNEANAKANLKNTEAANRKVEDVLRDQPEDAENLLFTASTQFDYNDYLSPDLALMLNERDTFNETEKKMMDKYLAAQRIIEGKRAERSVGFIAGTGYFLDTAFSSILHNIGGTATSALGIEEDVTEGGFELAALAREANDLFVSDVSPEDFAIRFEAILDRVADAGIFSEENPFYLEGFLSLGEEGGVGMESRMEGLFQILDVASLGTSGALRGISGAARKGGQARAISKVHSAEKAQEIVVRTGDQAVDSAVLTEGTSVSMIRPAIEDPNYYTAPEQAARRDLEANNQMLKAFNQIDFGPYVDPSIKAAKKAEWLKETRELNKNYKRRELNYAILDPDAFGNIVGRAVLGTDRGTPFKTEVTAQKFADKVGGKVLQQIHEGNITYVVAREWNIPTAGLVDPTDVKDLASGFFSSIISTTARTTPKLDAILKQGEAKTSLAVRELGTQYKKVRRGTWWFERRRVDEILQELRDDPVHNWRKEPYTPEEFGTRYEDLVGRPARQEVVDYYKTLVELNDIDYFINADRILKEAVNNGEEMVKVGDVFYRSRVADDIADDQLVYKPETGQLVPPSEVPEGFKIRELEDLLEVPGMGPVRYIVLDSPVTRRLYHSDVLPYNAGGHRKYNTPQLFFLKQENDITLAGGVKHTGRPTTFMGVRFEAEAAQAVEQFNTIVRTINDGGDINKVILSNNDWNLSIEDLDDFRNFASEHNLDITKEIGYAADGEMVEGGFAGKGTVGDGFRSSLNTSRVRGAKPLTGFGGNELDTLSPSKSIERGFAQTVARRGETNYLFNAIEGWVKAAEAEGAITNMDMVAGLRPRAKLEAAVLTKKGVGKALEAERQTIRQRLSNTTALVAAERNLLRSMADFVYGKGAKRLAKALDWSSTKDPAGFMRAVAFHSKLGLFNIDQLYVQANQIVNILGVTSATLGPVGAMRGVLGVMPMRMALIPSIPDGALQRIAKIQAPFTGISADEFINLRNWFMQSGRNIVDRTVVEENNSAAFLGNTLLDWGQFFFNEGELASRVAAATTNFLERKAKGFKEDIFDPAVTRQMIHRQDVLTASMTSASAAPWQRSTLAVPLQFTTYHVRMAEQLLTDQILTPKERRHLLLSHILFYGAAAIPAAGYLQDKLGFNGELNPETKLYDVARYGALDALLTELSGEETALSSRLAVGEGLWDLFMKLSEEPLPTIAAGPGGTITIDSVSAMVKFMKNVAGGQFDQTEYDWHRFARNVSSYNKAYTFFLARRYGMMTSRKTEAPTMTDMNNIETVLVTMGVPLAEQDLLWTSVTNLDKEKKHVDRLIKDIVRLDNITSRLMLEDEPDWDHIGSLLDDMGAHLELLTPSERTKALTRLRFNGEIPASVIRSLIKHGHPQIAEKLQEMIQ